MRERPILFSSPMVRAVLDGSKSQTRRVVKLRHWQIAAAPIIDGVFEWWPMRHVERPTALEKWSRAVLFGACPYGQVGDRLYVRETWFPDAPLNGWSGDVEWDGCGRAISGVPSEYRSPANCLYAATFIGPPTLRWKPSIHMPRWASRIALEITGVRVERLQEISEADAIAEGTDATSLPLPDRTKPGVGYAPSMRHEYRDLWDSLNGKRGYGWDVNPWVWVLSFRRVTP